MLLIKNLRKVVEPEGLVKPLFTLKSKGIEIVTGMMIYSSRIKKLGTCKICTLMDYFMFQVCVALIIKINQIVSQYEA